MVCRETGTSLPEYIIKVGMLNGEETPFDIITSPKNPLILGFPWL